MSKTILKTGLLVLLTAFFVMGMTVTPAAAANAKLNYSADATQNPTLHGDVTVATLDMSWDEDPATIPYEDDSGEVADHPGDVNTSVNNTYEFLVTDINASDFREFPHQNDSVEFTDSGVWSTNTGISVAEVETAPGSKAIEFSTNGSFTDGDSATATFDLTAADVEGSITTDEEKRYLQVGFDVTTLDSSAIVEVRAVDEDGDYYYAEVNASRSTGEDLMANATGDGYFFQRQLGDMTLQTNGDGTFNDIQKVEIVAQDADTTLEVMALNLDKTGMYDFGEELVDNDDDDELETETIREVNSSGAIKIHDLGTMGTAFDEAELHDVTIPFKMNADDLDGEDVAVAFEDPSANYGVAEDEQLVTLNYRYELPDAYDLSYANLEFDDEAQLPQTRYQSVEYKEATGDTEFADIDFDAGTDLTSSYDSLGAEITIDSTIQPGQALSLEFKYVVSPDEQSAMQDVGGGAMGPTGESGGGLSGIIDWLMGVPGAVIAVGVSWWRQWPGMVWDKLPV